MSVTADAFNNLSDAGSSVIGMIGVKIAEKPADKEHPFGHGRLEYMAALIASFLVIEVGLPFSKNAIVKIREPEELKFSLVSILILVLSIGVKLWLAMFNRKLGEKISSQVMMATAADALGDVITTLQRRSCRLYYGGSQGSISMTLSDLVFHWSLCGPDLGLRRIRLSR